MRVLVLLLHMSCISMLHAGQWPSLQGNQYFTGNNDEIVPASLDLNWVLTNSAGVYYPAAADGRIFFSSIDRNLTCLDTRTGVILWKYRTGAPLIRGAVVSGGHVIIAAGFNLIDIDSDSGKVRWSVSEDPVHVLVQPIIDGERVLYGTRKRMVCRDLGTDRLIWENTGISLYGGSASVADGIVFIQSRDYGQKEYSVAAVDVDSGVILWRNTIGEDASIFTPVAYGGNVYVSARNQVYCFDAATGRSQWARSAGFRISSEAIFADRRLFLAGENGQIAVMDPYDGGVLERLKFLQGRNWFACAGENLFVLEVGSATLFRIDMGTWARTMGFRSPSHATNGGHAFIIADGKIFVPVNRHLLAVGGKDSFSEPARQDERMLTVRISGERTNAVNAEVSDESSGRRAVCENGICSIGVARDSEVRLTIAATNYMIETLTVSTNETDVSLRLRPLVRGMKFVLKSVYFDADRSDLKKDSIPVLLAVCGYMEQNPGTSLRITGHTDGTGGRDYNMGLSLRRADRVRAFLVKNGVGESRLITEGKGDIEPVADNLTEDGRSLNRRIEFTVR